MLCLGRQMLSPCYERLWRRWCRGRALLLKEVWTLLCERIFIASDNTEANSTSGADGRACSWIARLYAQAMEIVLEAAKHVPKVNYAVDGDDFLIRFTETALEIDISKGLVLKINHLIKVISPLHGSKMTVSSQSNSPDHKTEET